VSSLLGKIVENIEKLENPAVPWKIKPGEHQINNIFASIIVKINHAFAN